MANRKLPFGYRMQEGKITEHPVEAETVRWIFQQYIAGESYLQITEALREQNTAYIAGKFWNKNMTARILADQRYTGEGGFPPLLDRTMYQSARTALQCKAVPRRKTPSCAAVQKLTNYGKCGGKVPNEKILRETIHLLNKLIAMPDLVTYQDSGNDCALPCEETEFKELLNTNEFDEAAARAKAFDLASARFDALGSADYETMRIQHILVNKEQDSELDAGLLFAITSAILIHSTGAVSLKLKNGQIVKRSDLT